MPDIDKPAGAESLLRRYKSLEDALDRAGYLSEDPLSNFASPLSDWMSSLTSQITGEESSGNPFTQYLTDTTRKLQEDLENMGRRASDPAELYCCLVAAIYHMADGDEGDARRPLKRSEFLQWLGILREILVTLRQAETAGSSIRVSLGVLSLDVSARIQTKLYQGLVGPLLQGLSSLEWMIQSLGQRVQRAVARTRCQPIIELWAAIITWVYGVQSGLSVQVRSFAQSVLVQLHRSIVAGASETGQQIEQEELWRWERVGLLIEAIDIIVEAADLFQVCRMDIPEDGSSSDETPRGATTPGEGSPSGRRPRRPAESGTEEDTPSLGGSAGLYSSGDLDADANDAPASPFERGFSSDSPARDDFLYLTPSNVRLLAARTSDDPDLPARTAIDGSCRDSLTSETAQFLEEIGIL